MASANASWLGPAKAPRVTGLLVQDEDEDEDDLDDDEDDGDEDEDEENDDYPPPGWSD